MTLRALFRSAVDRFDYSLLRLIAALAVVFVALCSFAVHAQTVLLTPEPGAPAGPAWVTALVQYVVTPLIPILGTLLAAALVKLSTYLHAKESNSKVAGAFAIATDFLQTSFTHVRAGIESDLKMALADGTLDASERAFLVAKLVQLVKAELPAGIMAILGGALGPALETWLNGKAGEVIQAAVAEAPTGVAAVKAPTSLLQAAGLIPAPSPS